MHCVAFNKMIQAIWFSGDCCQFSVNISPLCPDLFRPCSANIQSVWGSTNLSYSFLIEYFELVSSFLSSPWYYLLSRSTNTNKYETIFSSFFRAQDKVESKKMVNAALRDIEMRPMSVDFRVLTCTGVLRTPTVLSAKVACEPHGEFVLRQTVLTVAGCRRKSVPCTGNSAFSDFASAGGLETV